jgi:hypothetical protein
MIKLNKIESKIKKKGYPNKKRRQSQGSNNK